MVKPDYVKRVESIGKTGMPRVVDGQVRLSGQVTEDGTNAVGDAARAFMNKATMGVLPYAMDQIDTGAKAAS